MFTLLLQKSGLQSKVWFGGFDLDSIRKNLAQFYWQSEIDEMSAQEVEQTISWVPLKSYFYWSTTLESVKVKDTTMPVSVNNAIYVTTEPLTLVPSQEYRALIDLITKG